MAYTPRHMKWWGWGDAEASFDSKGHPGFWPYAKEQLGIEGDAPAKPPATLEEMQLPEAIVNTRFLSEIKLKLHAGQISDERYERVVHAYGKGFRDLYRLRHGWAEGAPDLVIYPEKEEEVAATLRAAARNDVMVIPFGGGSNISGCLERMESGRMAVSLDMRRMRRVMEVDGESGTARAEAGVFGPDLEEQLAAHGMTLGHFPDSFLHSTLGGWIATRSAGMQSDKYGKIEDMVVALRMVTPEGVLETRRVPKSSNGIDVNHMCIGSEGTLGVITEATMRVHARAEARVVPAYLFREFEGGLEAMRECVRRECMPAMVRLNDPDKTALSVAFKPPSSELSRAASKIFKGYLRAKGFELPRACLMLTAFEGRKGEVTRQLRRVEAIYEKYGGVSLGQSSGKSFEATKYDFPHIRDFLLERDVTTDVSETATVWRNILPLYKATIGAIRARICESGAQPWSGCHISHTYHSGASLYFTFGFKQQAGREMEQYLKVKRAVQQSFIDHGATLSHHHAVGTEHLPWLAADVSPVGVKAVAALKQGLDPGNSMNPGRLAPTWEPFEDWSRIGRQPQEKAMAAAFRAAENGRGAATGRDAAKR
ncbi:MAG TPA: FAD-binding oxidoreductase [Verrucomicrobiae bacterium]|nr:FAD-binding oxidoreductase [Verrucomicrobiae bacterium]